MTETCGLTYDAGHTISVLGEGFSSRPANSGAKIRAMPLTLLVSDTLLPADISDRIEAPRLAGLETLLARGNTKHQPGLALEEWLLGAWGWGDNTVAPLTLLADGVAPGDAVWMRADPVHLHIERDHIQLFDHHVFKLEQVEADALVASLNQHFAQDGLSFLAPTAKRWYCRIDASEAPLTTPLWRVLGRGIFDYMPVSQGKRDWKSLANEIQMLFFEHPINQAREARRELPINGVWLWGAGQLPATSPATSFSKASMPYSHIYADVAVAQGMALHGGSVLYALPAHFAALDSGDQSNTLVVLHTLTRALRAADHDAWVTNLAALERDWFAPALAALKSGALDGLRLCLPCEQVTLACSIKRSDFYKFWRFSRPLSSYAAHA